MARRLAQDASRSTVLSSASPVLPTTSGRGRPQGLLRTSCCRSFRPCRGLIGVPSPPDTVRIPGLAAFASVSSGLLQSSLPAVPRRSSAGTSYLWGRTMHSAPGAAVTGAVAGGMAERVRQLGGGAAGSDRLPPPPYPALVGSEARSFANATITARLPAIMESMIRDVQADLQAAQPEVDQAGVLAELRALRQAMLDDGPLKPLSVPAAPEQTQVLLDSANACVELMTSRQQHQQHQQLPGPPSAAEGPGATAQGSSHPDGQATWLGLPWLTVECYMYGAIHAAMQRQPLLAGLDPFHRQKAAAWAKSAAAAAEMADEVELLTRALAAARPTAATAAAAPSAAADGDGMAAAAAAAAGSAQAEEAAARAAALAGLQMALWGNKADLSLLVNAAGLDGLSLSVNSGSDEKAKAREGTDTAGGSSAAAVAATAPPPRVIVDDSEAVWGVMARLQASRAAGGGGGGPGGGGGGGGVRVDIVLDNSGLELFADLCLAELLMQAGVADHVVLHGKVIPWFVSDTLYGDLEELLDSCEAERPPSSQVSPEAWQPVRRLAAVWRAHLAAGSWTWTAHPFWCTPAPFCWMADVAPDLYESLSGSGLVVFKGDLNYRKLAHDCRWPHTTPFETALQGFRPAPLVTLRTLKADVVAGLAPGLSECLSAADPDWLVDGKWGMVQAHLL